jgi:alkanesulfonate monooxygenase SsuD/methylene tetrahydromethanopterin reductase-like flavin-dependent oxidoreductase (luciferase family)
LVRLGIVVRGPGAADLAILADHAGVDVVWVASADEAVRLSSRLRRCTVAVRPDKDEPWARTLGVSIGRTSAEANARAALDDGFDRDGSIVGTLETGQGRVAALAAEGVVDLRCVLPDTPDVADLVGQLTAMVVGSAETHRPDAPRSADPPAPDFSAWPGER